MRVLMVHNYYQQRGGEESIFETESGLLELNGHVVDRYTVHNDQIEGENPFTLASNTLWNQKIYRDLRRVIRQNPPQIVHFHNTFPVISPSAYYAAKAEGIPVVQTLHNYRLLCPNALFFREGKLCLDCLGKPIPFPGVIHGCYRDSRVASAGVAAMLSLHSFLKTWSKAVDAFVVYSQFALNKFVEGGLPPEKLLFKTNSLHPAPEVGQGQGGYALFVGRLSVEKGLGVMLKAWEQLDGKIPLKIVGDGPMLPLVKDVQSRVPGVEWLGRKSLDEVYQLMGEASFLVFPSEWYETFGRVAIEAFAKGTPVIAADIGAISELVTHKHTGLRFCASDPSDLVAQVEWALSHPEEMVLMRQTARTEFETKYTANSNYQRLIEIYHQAQTNALQSGQKRINAVSPANL
jgi:glycosyltransferase involved in cell wall biosynthesis